MLPLPHLLGPYSFCARRVLAAALLLAAAASPVGAQSSREHPYPVRRATSEVVVDGRVVEEAWADALTLELRYEVRPGENVEPPVRTEMFLTYDDTRLLVAFKCHDPDPSQIRARYTDRDNAWNDDFVGVVLDTFNDERRAYELFVNAYGVQMDAVNDDVAGNYDMAWGAIWDSAGRITDAGYEVEMAIPFNQLRFQDADGAQTWGIDGVRSYPRLQRHHIGLFPRLRGANSYLSQEEKIAGFDGVEPGRNLEFLPTVTATRTDERPAGADGPLTQHRTAGDVGLTARWGITPNVTADVAANPDFSQVEADAVQLDVNNQFALFFPETRPFFLEGADHFRLAAAALHPITGFRRMNLVHTRTVADPIGALKTTGKHGRHSYGVFAAEDARTNVLVPGSQRSETERFDVRTAGTVGRYRMDYGRNSAIGASLTSREGDAYFNRVLAVDTRHRLGDADSVSLTVARSATRYDDAMRTRFAQSAGVLDGGAVEAHYQHTTRNWLATAGYSDYDDTFRADLGFVTQVGFRKWEGHLVRLWHGDGAFNQIGMGGLAEYLERQNGAVLERAAAGWVSYIGPRESFAFAMLDRRDRMFSGIEFPQWRVRANLQTRPHGDVLFATRFERGDQIDFAHAREGTEVRFQPALTVNLGRHWLLQYTHTFNAFDLPQGRLFTANVAEPRLVYQINTRTFVRAILQFTDIRRDASLYRGSAEAEDRRLFTQFLFSYKVNPQTVLYLGYSDNSVGTDRFGLLRADRTFFVKAGYAWLL